MGAILIVVMAGGAYRPALRAGYLWDDDDYVSGNPALQSADGLRQIWFEPTATVQYYPLVFTTFWLEYRLWGLDAAGYHATNIVLHIVNALLLWLVLHRLRVPGALLAGGLFALHPVHVESVAFVAERKDVLSGLFYLLTVVAWLRYVEHRSWRRYAAVMLLFVAAMLSKTMVCTLPVALLLLAWWRNPASLRREIPQLLPLLAIGVGLSMVTIWREALDHTPTEPIGEPLSLVQHILMANDAIWFYAGKLIWPTNLMIIYPRWSNDPRQPGPYLFAIATFGIVATLWWLRARLGRGPLTAVLLFALTLTPVLGFLDFDLLTEQSYVADHLQYLPSIALIALLSAAAAALTAGLDPVVRLTLSGLVLLPMTLLTARQSGLYQDAETLWRDNLAKNPQAWKIHTNLGATLSQRGKAAEATEHFAAATHLHPQLAEVHYNYGSALLASGQARAGVAELEQAVAMKPSFAVARLALGEALYELGQTDEARRQFAETLAINPSDPDLQQQVAEALVRLGQVDEAIEHLEATLQLRPGDVAATRLLRRLATSARQR